MVYHKIKEVELITKYKLKCGHCGEDIIIYVPCDCMGPGHLSIDDPYLCHYCKGDAFIDEDEIINAIDNI